MEPDGSGSVNGRRVRLSGEQDPYTELSRHAVVYARTLGRPVRVRASSMQGVWHLIAHPDGDLSTLRRPHSSAARWVADPTVLKPASVPASSPATIPSGAVVAVRADEAGNSEADPGSAHPVEPPRNTAAVTVPDPVDSSPDRAGKQWAFPPSTVPIPEEHRLRGGGWAITAPGASSQQESPWGAGLQETALQAYPGKARTGTNRRPVPIGAVAGSTVGIILLLLAALATVPRNSSPPPAPHESASSAVTSTPSSRTASMSRPVSRTVAAPVASPAALAAAAPGHSTQPLWAYGVDGAALIDLGPDGLIATRTPDGHVVGLDAATGRPQWWTTDTYVTGWAGPHLTHIDGHLVVALASRDQLLFWPVPTVTGPIAAEPTSVALPLGATLSWGGPSPLVVLGTSSAAVVHDGALQLVPLPAGARPLVADGTDVLAARGTTWMRAGVGATPKPHTIATPTGAIGAPVRVEAVAATYLLAVWAKSRAGVQTVALIDAVSGKTLVSTRLPATVDISRVPITRQVGGSLLGIGSFVVDTDVERLRPLMAQYKVISLTRGHIYAKDTAMNRTVDIRIVNGEYQVIPLPPGADVPFGAVSAGAQGATARPLAMITTSTPTGWFLQALPATS